MLFCYSSCFFSSPGSAIQGWTVGAVFLLLCGSVSSSYAALPVIDHMCLCKGGGEGPESVWGVGGLFPFKVAEASRKKRSFIWLSFQEFRWLAV